MGFIGPDEKVKEQVLAIRDTGLTNMFDLPYVQRLAFVIIPGLRPTLAAVQRSLTALQPI